jgi:hypothetical protein
MTIVADHFEDLHFTESKIERFEFIRNDLIVYIKSGLEVYDPHPLAKTYKFTNTCKIIFKNVKSSKRIFDRYDEISKNYIQPEEIVEDFKLDSPSIHENYSIEGFLLKPQGWITWEIEAEEFYLDDLKN